MADALDPTTAVASADDPPPTHFEIAADEGTADGLRRIVLEQVALASWHARRVGVADKHVHGVRLATKRVRAVLRMARDGLGEDSYLHHNGVFRDMARDLSAVRSATVRVETLEALLQRRGSLVTSVAEVHSIVVADAVGIRAAALTSPPLVGHLIDRLQRVRTSLDGWTPSPALVPTAAGLQRTYRRGRCGMARAFADWSTGHLHEWRKQVKYLRYQMEVLTTIRPDTMPTITAGFAELGDALGLVHDLADLGYVVGGPRLSVTSAGKSELLDAIADWRNELLTDLQPPAERLYAQTPRDFAREMTSYWEEWLTRDKT